MLLILMYHRAGSTLHGNSVSVLRSHFETIRRRFPVVLPGEPLRSGGLNLCLTFDDATVDFYARVFPLLEEFSLRALLAVPTSFIVENTDLSYDERLSAPQERPMAGETVRERVPFCTWRELERMAASGLVQIASHSHTHQDMTDPEVDVDFEARHSKAILEQRLHCRVTTFVYPFGKVDGFAHQRVGRYYPFAVRIGFALNRGWSPRHQPLCRVEADRVADIDRLFRWDRLLSYGLKWTANGVRAALGKWRAGGLDGGRAARTAKRAHEGLKRVEI